MKRILLIFLIPLLVACSAEDPISREYPCRFTFYSGLHEGHSLIFLPSLRTTYNFCTVKVTPYNGYFRMTATDRNGKSETIDLQNQIEIYAYQSGIFLGAGNEIIAGATMDGPVAYDAQCPNCLEEYGRAAYRLSWADNAFEVKCMKCGRTYNLQTGACNQGGRRLMQYIVDLNRQINGIAAIVIGN